jgi:hypothetical protein
MGKFIRDRCVWHPYKQPAGMSSDPMLSDSTRGGKDAAGSTKASGLGEVVGSVDEDDDMMFRRVVGDEE